MKKTYFSLFLLLVLFIIGCGGGGGNPVVPSNHDLSGLVGTWDVTVTADGNLSSSFGPMPFHETYTTFWVIDSQHVLREDGAYYVWSYDGKQLDLSYSSTESYVDPDCGDVYGTSAGTLHVSVTPGSNHGKITGYADIDLQTAYCGNASGKINYNGNASKR